MDEDSSNNNGGVYIYNGVDEVPDDVKRVRVEPFVFGIPKGAFQSRFDLEEVELPEGLITIEKRAFYDCASLKRVKIPSTVIEIGREAFDSCQKLIEIVLPQGLQRLGKWAFNECKSLQRINIPPGIQTFEKGAFWDCFGLLEVSISEGVQEIGEDAFLGCESLESVYLPSSLKNIEESAFRYCKGLGEVHLPDTVETIETRAFNNCSFQNFHVPPLLTEFDMSVVGHNECMVSLELSENVTTIDGNSDLKSLRNIALPSECNVGRRMMNTWEECTDLRSAFPNEDGDAISDALKHRFDDLPIHKIYYYQSYHPTENVMQNLKREINPWISKFPGQLNMAGKEQDCLGMTPLHILACSTQQHVKMYRLLIEKYPETLLTKDKWGGIPLLYAIWCNVPADIVQLLVKSYKSIYPEHVFDWGGMILTLAKRNVPHANIQTLVSTQRNSFPDQHYDMQNVMMDLAAHDKRQSSFSRLASSIETFRYLLHISISDRLDSLNVRKWRIELEGCVNEFPDKASVREEGARALYAKLETYESLKEGTSILELALWKAKIDDFVSRNSGQCCNKRARVDNEVSYKDQCRINCGADIVVRNVLRYLLPK